MKIKDWLLDLAMHNYVSVVNDEVCILPIMEDEYDDCDKET